MTDRSGPDGGLLKLAEEGWETRQNRLTQPGGRKDKVMFHWGAICRWFSAIASQWLQQLTTCSEDMHAWIELHRRIHRSA
jgi:hypothetical protein